MIGTAAEAAHNPEVAGANPAPATIADLGFCPGQRFFVPQFWLVGTRFGTLSCSQRFLRIEGVADDQVGDGGGGRLVHARDDVAVDLERERSGRVPEAFADDLGRHSGLKGGAGVGVPDVVKPDLGQAGRSTVSIEQGGDRVGV